MFVSICTCRQGYNRSVFGAPPSAVSCKRHNIKNKVGENKSFQRKKADEVQTPAKIRINDKEIDKDMMNIEKSNKL